MKQNPEKKEKGITNFYVINYVLILIFFFLLCLIDLVSIIHVCVCVCVCVLVGHGVLAWQRGDMNETKQLACR